MIKEVFAFLAKEENYPVVIHCSIGTDRTGMMCFLINGLCGVSEEDLCIDYMFSNFGSIGGGRSADTIMSGYIPLVNQAEGDSLSEHIYNYLVDIGVPESDLDSVIALMTSK